MTSSADRSLSLQTMAGINLFQVGTHVVPSGGSICPFGASSWKYRSGLRAVPAGSLAFSEIRVGCNIIHSGIAHSPISGERPAFRGHSIERLERCVAKDGTEDQVVLGRVRLRPMTHRGFDSSAAVF